MEIIKIFVIAAILTVSAAQQHQLGCRFCLSCGGLFPYSGGRRKNTRDYGDWMIYGQWCSGEQPYQTLQEWSLCCTKDYDIEEGTCKFCTKCGSNHPYDMGSRVKQGDYGGIDTFSDSCSGFESNSLKTIYLCCTKPHLTSFCSGCQQGQVPGGAKLNQHDWGTWKINTQSDCGKMENLQTKWDQFNICSNPCLEGYSFKNGSCIPKNTLCHDDCDICSTSETCLSCNYGYVLQGGSCKKCNLGYYSDINVCKPCGTAQCTECTSPYLCTRCLSGSQPQQGYYSFKSGFFSATSEGISVGTQQDYHEGTYCFSEFIQGISWVLLFLMNIHIV